MIARSAAERALRRPFLVTIGGGAEVEDRLEGLVLEVMRLSTVYGETRAFVNDPNDLRRLEQWPVAIAGHDVWRFESPLHLITDLGFEDRLILSNAFDTIVRPEAKIEQLRRSLCGRRLSLRNLPPLANFRARSTVYLASTYLPRKISAEEGRKLYQQSVELERNRNLARAAKEANRVRHGGIYVCEACGLAHEMAALFDVHHLVPLSLGQQHTVLADLAVLCPNCHRAAHVMAADRYDPLPISLIRERLGSKRHLSKSGILSAVTG